MMYISQVNPMCLSYQSNHACMHASQFSSHSHKPLMPYEFTLLKKSAKARLILILFQKIGCKVIGQAQNIYVTGVRRIVK